MKTVCPFCGCGCQLNLKIKKGRIAGAKPIRLDTVSQGKPCIKGLHAYESVYSDDRLKAPMIRVNGKLKTVTWKEAYDYVYENTRDIGPDEIAFYASSPATIEDCFLFKKFAWDVFGTTNLDSPARLCHASTVYAFKQAFGISRMPAKFSDVKKADCILVIGSNPKANYPIIFNRLLKAKKKGTKLVCVRDWLDDTSKHADLYAEIKTGTEYFFINGLLAELVRNNKVIVPSWLKPLLNKHDINSVSKKCGTPISVVLEVLDHLAKCKHLLLIYGMNLTQSVNGVDNVLSAVNLALAKNGRIMSMRGKANIQGVGDMGCEPQRGGDTFINSVFNNKVNAYYIMESNPAQSLPALNKAHELFKNSFIILQTSFPSKTMDYASVVLPSSTWAERDGCFTNAESRVRYFKKAVEPIHNTKPNWQILIELAARFHVHYDYKNAWSVLKDIKKSVSDYRNINLKRLRRGWSVSVYKKPVRSRFSVVSFDEPRASNGFILTTERSAYHFCTGSMSRRCQGLNELHEGPYCLINQSDAKRLGVKDNDEVKLKSDEGFVVIKAKATTDVPKGLLVAPFHFKEVLINKLMPLEYDPDVQEPNFKRIPVEVNKV